MLSGWSFVVDSVSVTEEVESGVISAKVSTVSRKSGSAMANARQAEGVAMMNKFFNLIQNLED